MSEAAGMRGETATWSGGRLLRMRPCRLKQVWATAAEVAPVEAGRMEGGSPKSTALEDRAEPRAARERCRTPLFDRSRALPGDGAPGTATRERARTARLAVAPASRPRVEVAFYRKYTEAMLRRYLRLSMEAGRVPSLLGREMFRGNVTSYRVSSFEDVVAFCIDVERCLARLNAAEQDLIRRVALQEYTQGEAASLLGMSLRSVVSGYAGAVDRLTGLLIEKRMLEPLKSCQ